ncbi:MAG: hydrolase [Rhodobacteraceae bacterium]|nr:hydrolase [Paracoccaceae bacterium]
MLLSRASSQLLIVDVQERLLPAMHEPDRLLERCAVLLEAAARLGVPTTLSEQYRKGLGPTATRLDNLRGDSPILEKMHFSCAEDPGLAQRIGALAAEGRRQVVVAGIESHVCVLQSALGFKAMGYDVAVVMDAVSSRQPASIDLARQRYLANGVSAVNTEMALFEWLDVSGTPEFKDVSKLIK